MLTKNNKWFYKTYENNCKIEKMRYSNNIYVYLDRRRRCGRAYVPTMMTLTQHKKQDVFKFKFSSIVFLYNKWFYKTYENTFNIEKWYIAIIFMFTSDAEDTVGPTFLPWSPYHNTRSKTYSNLKVQITISLCQNI